MIYFGLHFAGHKMSVMQGMIDDIPFDIHDRHLFPDNIAIQPRVGDIPDKYGPDKPGAFGIKNHLAVSCSRGMFVYFEIVRSLFDAGLRIFLSVLSCLS